jgi:hypothetical protein
MTEQEKEPAQQMDKPRPRKSGSGPHIDVERHLESRRAVRDLLTRQKIFVSSRRFSGGGMASARVLVQGEYYDVNDRQLAQLRQGLSPAELMLEPAGDEL